MSNPNFFSNDYDWKITEKQFDMLSDKLRKLSKKEASMVYKFIQHVLLASRNPRND